MSQYEDDADLFARECDHCGELMGQCVCGDDEDFCEHGIPREEFCGNCGDGA